MTSQSNLLGTYTYNGFDQLITRVITNSGSANGTINTVQDIWGNPGLRRGRLNCRARRHGSDGQGIHLAAGDGDRADAAGPY